MAKTPVSGSAHPTVVAKAVAIVARLTDVKGVTYWMSALLRIALYSAST